MKKLNKLAIVGLVSASALSVGLVQATEIDSDSANVSMSIGLYAALTGLDDFTLSTSGVDGAAGAIYSGSDSYNLESNGQVRVSLSGGDLSNGSDSVSTSYSLDGSGVTFDTTSSSVHNAAHSVSADATLGDISSQASGSYSAVITMTVSSI